MTATARRVRRDSRRVVDRTARLGLAARGVVYLLIGWTAVRIAFGNSGQEADRQGALQQFAHHTAGKVLLVVMAIGFLGYAAWRATEAVSGPSGSADDDAKQWAKRGGSAGRAVLYLFFAYSTARTAFAGSSGSSSDSTSKRATAGLLGHQGGRTLVVLAGAGFAIAGVVLAVRGILRKFEKNLRTGTMSKRAERVVGVLGVAGQTARGVVFTMIGAFLIEAAVDYDPQRARGLDGALRTLAHGGWGRTALVLVAVGLASFGAYSLVEARYRRT